MTAKYSAEWWEKLTAISACEKRHDAGPTVAEPDRGRPQHVKSDGSRSGSESRIDLEQVPTG
jgi:hypothetical protein